MNMTSIRSTGVALPAHRISQEESRKACAAWFKDLPRIDALLELFDRAGVGERHLCNPLSYYFETHSFEKRNRDYVRHSIDLGKRAIQSALDAAGCGPRDIDQFYFVTTTGLATPSVDTLLA